MSRPHYADKDEPPRKGSLWRSLLIIAVGAWLLRSLIISPFSIPSGSMLPQLMIGDHLFAAKWPYGYSRYSFPLGIPSFRGRILGGLPERGDIAVFQDPDGSGIDVIKRVIGLPGDTVAMSDGMLILNGRPVAREPADSFAMPISPNSPCRVVPGASPQVIANPAGGQSCLYPLYRETLPNGRSYLVIDQVDNPAVDDFGPVKVPQGTLFMLGDNRDDSGDSRFPTSAGGVGFVPLDHLVGRAMINFWSTDGSAEWLKPWTWFTALRAGRIGDVHSR